MRGRLVIYLKRAPDPVRKRPKRWPEGKRQPRKQKGRQATGAAQAVKRKEHLPAPEDVAAGRVSVAARGIEEEVCKVAPLDVLFLGGNVREVQLPYTHQWKGWGKRGETQDGGEGKQKRW